MKVGIITGGSRGLGKASALSAATKGHDVILTYNSHKAEADSVVAEIESMGRKAVALQLDTSNTRAFPAFAEAVRTVLKQNWGRDSFDFLVNNAGFALHAGVEETTEEQFDQIVNVHFKGVYFLTQALLPMLANGGRIINMSTGLTRFSFPGSSAYAAAKGAVEVLTRYLAVELGQRGISVNTVAPGAIATDFSGGMVRDNPAISQHIAAETPLGRVGQADDVGGVVAALLDDNMAWVNGQRIEISGGIRN